MIYSFIKPFIATMFEEINLIVLLLSEHKQPLTTSPSLLFTFKTTELVSGSRKMTYILRFRPFLNNIAVPPTIFG